MTAISTIAVSAVLLSDDIVFVSHVHADQTVHAAPEDGGPRRLEVSTREGLKMYALPAADAKVIVVLEHKAILSNFGCKDIDSQSWCAVRPLKGRMQGHVRGESLNPARGPDGAIPIGRDDSAERAAKGDFDVKGKMPCAQTRDQAMGECTFGIARGTGGDATVVATFANGFKRKLFFQHGEFIRADTTMSGNGFDTDWDVQGELHFIRVDDQRYELPGIAIFGN